MQEPNGPPGQQPSPETLAAQILTAAARVTDGMPAADAHIAVDIAWHAIPHAPLGATRAQWAEQVRRVAEAIR